jgi:protein arginine N-methyltransferase 1
MYDIVDYGRMVGDRLRTKAYARAIEQVVKTGDVVLDLGAGTGLFAMLACRAGARRVFAVDTSPYLQIAREFAALNGFANRIECIEGDSRELTLPEPANVIVADVRGVLPFFASGLLSMIDARTRHLAPGGAIIPKCDTIFAALLESPDAYERHVGPWTYGFEGLDLTPARRLAVHESHKLVPHPRELLSPRKEWLAIDYATVTSTDAQQSVTLTARHDGVAHGLALSFDARLADGAGFSNDDSDLYGSVFFPFEEPVELYAGDAIEVDIAARLINADNADDYLWLWNTALVRGERTTPLFRQSSFFAYPHAVG